MISFVFLYLLDKSNKFTCLVKKKLQKIFPE